MSDDREIGAGRAARGRGEEARSLFPAPLCRGELSSHQPPCSFRDDGWPAGGLLRSAPRGAPLASSEAERPCVLTPAGFCLRGIRCRVPFLSLSLSLSNSRSSCMTPAFHRQLAIARTHERTASIFLWVIVVTSLWSLTPSYLSARVQWDPPDARSPTSALSPFHPTQGVQGTGRGGVASTQTAKCHLSEQRKTYTILLCHPSRHMRCRKKEIRKRNLKGFRRAPVLKCREGGNNGWVASKVDRKERRREVIRKEMNAI